MAIPPVNQAQVNDPEAARQLVERLKQRYTRIVDGSATTVRVTLKTGTDLCLDKATAVVLPAIAEACPSAKPLVSVITPVCPGAVRPLTDQAVDACGRKVTAGAKGVVSKMVDTCPGFMGSLLPRESNQ